MWRGVAHHWGPAEADAARPPIRPTADRSDLRACRLVIESGPESLQLKRDVLRPLEQ